MNNSEGSFVIKNKIFFNFFFSDMKCSNTEILKNCPKNLHPDRPLPYHKCRNTNVSLNFLFFILSEISGNNTYKIEI